MTSLAFPLSFARTGRARLASLERRIVELVEMLLFTVPGERVMRPDLGTPIHDMVFEGINDALGTALQAAIHGALIQHLTGLVELRAVDVDIVENSIEVRVEYANPLQSESTVLTFKRERP